MYIYLYIYEDEEKKGRTNKQNEKIKTRSVHNQTPMTAVILPELCRVFPEYTEQLEESTKPAVSADALQTAARCIRAYSAPAETDAVSCVSHARTGCPVTAPLIGTPANLQEPSFRS